jgi:calcium binding protein 39
MSLHSLMSSPHPLRFYNFIDYIEQTTFGIACDAQANFKVCYRSFARLVRTDPQRRKHSRDTSRWSQSSWKPTTIECVFPFSAPCTTDPLEQFFDSYALLVQSTNYVTKRQSLKLLGEILLDRTNFKVMTRYIANEDNLKMMMNLLKDKSKNIQFEAFHVFKVSSQYAWSLRVVLMKIWCRSLSPIRINHRKSSRF